MPINPNISLAVQPPQMPSLMEQAAQMLTLKDLVGRRNLTEIEKQRMQQALRDEHTFIDIINRNDGDLARAIPEAIKVMGPRAASVVKPVVEMQSFLDKMNEQTRQQVKEMMHELGAKALWLLDLPEQSRPDAYKILREELIKEGYNADVVGKFPAEYPGDEIIKETAMTFLGFEKYMDLKERKAEAARKAEEAARKAEAERRAAQLHTYNLAKAEAEAAKAQREAEPGAEIDAMFPDYYKAWLHAHGMEPTPKTRFEAYKDFIREKRNVEQLMSPEVLAQRERLARAAIKPEKTEAEKRHEDWRDWVNAANSRMSQENRTIIELGLDSKNYPSGTELASIHETLQQLDEKIDAGQPLTPDEAETRKNLRDQLKVRRWGGGREMPLWLAKAYLRITGGDRKEADRRARADGWDTRKVD